MKKLIFAAALAAIAATLTACANNAGDDMYHQGAEEFNSSSNMGGNASDSEPVDNNSSETNSASDSSSDSDISSDTETNSTESKD